MCTFSQSLTAEQVHNPFIIYRYKYIKYNGKCSLCISKDVHSIIYIIYIYIIYIFLLWSRWKYTMIVYIPFWLMERRLYHSYVMFDCTNAFLGMNVLTQSCCTFITITATKERWLSIFIFILSSKMYINCLRSAIFINFCLVYKHHIKCSTCIPITYTSAIEKCHIKIATYISASETGGRCFSYTFLLVPCDKPGSGNNGYTMIR